MHQPSTPPASNESPPGSGPPAADRGPTEGDDSVSCPALASELRRTVLLGGLALAVGTTLLYGLGLGTNDLWAPDEPRYGAIAEELRSFRHGFRGLVLLHLGDAPYTQKPPLYFWLAALFGMPTGRVTELAARAPSAIAGVASIALTAWIGRRLLRRWLPAFVAAGLLATSFRFVFTARRAQLDVLLCAFELLAVALFLAIDFDHNGSREQTLSPRRVMAIHAALGAAALVKGPVGWLPVAVFAAYLGWEGRTRALRMLLAPRAWIFSVGPLALWAGAAIALAPPGFAEAAIGDNLLGRFFTGTSHARPFYYFLIQLPLDFLPWSLLLPWAIPLLWKRSRESLSPVAGETQAASAPNSQPTAQPHSHPRRSARFLLCWISIPFLFFSLSAGKRGVYLLPFFPALALICAGLIDRLPPRAGPRAFQIPRLPQMIAAVALFEVLLFALILPLLGDEKSPEQIARAATRHTAEGEPLGVYGMTPIEGGIHYYNGPPTTSLRTEEDLARFLENDGRVVLLRSRHLRELASLYDLEALVSFRSGKRSLAIARNRKFPIPEGVPQSPPIPLENP